VKLGNLKAKNSEAPGTVASATAPEKKGAKGKVREPKSMLHIKLQPSARAVLNRQKLQSKRKKRRGDGWKNGLAGSRFATSSSGYGQSREGGGKKVMYKSNRKIIPRQDFSGGPT